MQGCLLLLKLIIMIAQLLTFPLLVTDAFSLSSSTRLSSSSSRTSHLYSEKNQEKLARQAEELLAQAKQLRAEIGEYDTKTSTSETPTHATTLKVSEWSVESPSSDQEYRLYIDIGREEGTWMDPRWAASGRRIEGTLDIVFSSLLASDDITMNMVRDNQQGASSSTFEVQTATKVRLKGGFGQMRVTTGGYRLDASKNGGTLRFYVSTEGTRDGDISIPKGRLYFSLPSFPRGDRNDPSNMLLSTKEGIISVREMGWHTGWRRQESRIVGVFRAVPIEKARRIDAY